jgi:hypothetical protein
VPLRDTPPSSLRFRHHRSCAHFCSATLHHPLTDTITTVPTRRISSFQSNVQTA